MRRTGSIGEAALEAARQELEALANKADGMTKQQAVRRLGKSIRAAREKGVGMAEIAEALTKSGIEIRESTLKGYLGRGGGGERASARSPSGAEASGGTTTAEGTAERRAESAAEPVGGASGDGESKTPARAKSEAASGEKTAGRARATSGGDASSEAVRSGRSG